MVGMVRRGYQKPSMLLPSRLVSDFVLPATEMLVAVSHRNHDTIDHGDVRSCQSGRCCSLPISALTGAAQGAVIYSRRGTELVAIEMPPIIS